ncbi:MAG: ATP-binding domain-containing protein [Eubacteriales bacterium]
MATMIPGELYADHSNLSGGELQLFELLKNLPDDYYVFHSTQWNEKERKNTTSRRQYVQWGEADFTLFHPEFGLIVFEVKDGLISYQHEKGWVQKNRNSGYEKVIDPLAQAEKSKYQFLHLIEHKFRGKSPYPLCSAVCFTSVDRNSVEGNLPLHYKEELIIWLSDLATISSIERAIKGIFTFCGATKIPANPEHTEKVLQTLAPEFGSFLSMRSRSIAAKALFHKMTQEQSYLLDYLEEQQEAAIHGVAGTGKTVLAVQKAERLALNGEKVLFLCFNRFLKDHLEHHNTHENIDFFNLDGLLVKKTGRPLPQDSMEKDSAISDMLLDDGWEYQHIIIDEGQDFKNDHLESLKLLALDKNGCFYVFYDKNQFVQGISFPEWLNQMDCRLILSRNCRNTKEIAITSTRPIGIAESKIKMRRENPSANYTEQPKPCIFFLENKDEAKQLLVKLLKKYTSAGIPKENIVILTCKTENTSCLQPKDFKLTDAYQLSSTKESSKILFTTVRKFKGLEAEAVICIDIDTETFVNPTEKNAFYVGTSRATTALDLVTLSDPSDIATELTGAPVAKGPRSFKQIRDFLCVKIGSDADL